jgi:WD40 repeat protein
MFGVGLYRGVRLSPDGRSLLLAGPHDEASIHDVATGEARVTLRGHGGAVNSAEFDPRGTRVVTAGSDNTLRVWDAASGGQLASMAIGERDARAASFSPDGRYVISAGFDQPVRVWSVDGPLIAELGGSRYASFAQFNADGARLWTTEEGRARAWDTRDWRLHAEVSSSFATPSAVISLGEDHVLSSDQEGALELVAPDGRRTTFRGRCPKLNVAALGPDRSHLVTGHGSGKVIVWHTSNGGIASEIHDHTAEVTTIAFSRDGGIFATGSRDGTARFHVLRVRDLVTLARARLPGR